MGSEKLKFQRKRLILRGLAAKRMLNFWKFGCGTTVPHFSKLGEGLERHKKKLTSQEVSFILLRG